MTKASQRDEQKKQLERARNEPGREHRRSFHYLLKHKRKVKRKTGKKK